MNIIEKWSWKFFLEFFSNFVRISAQKSKKKTQKGWKLDSPEGNKSKKVKVQCWWRHHDDVRVFVRWETTFKAKYGPKSYDALIRPNVFSFKCILETLTIGYPTGWTIQRVKPYFSGLSDSWWFGFESEFWGSDAHFKTSLFIFNWLTSLFTSNDLRLGF